MSALLSINRRPGKLWSFLQYPLTRFFLAVLFVTVPLTLVQLAAKFAGIVSRSPLGAALSLVLIVVTFGGYAYYVRCIERRKVSELSTQGALLEFVGGAILGSALFGTTMLVLWLLGIWTYSGLIEGSTWVYPLFGALLTAAVEETLVRGVLFRLLEERLGSWIALGISALIFGIMHAFNPGASAISVVAIALEAGVLLAAAYMLTRRLWFVFGLHAAWNFTEGGIFATQVSGSKIEGLIGVQFQGNDLLSGGAFGPEASIVAVAICLLASTIILILAKKKGNVIRPFWGNPKQITG
ncbi:MAG: type II CAAX endopeptidase family protein [Dokdonella sp.]